MDAGPAAAGLGGGPASVWRARKNHKGGAARRGGRAGATAATAATPAFPAPARVSPFIPGPRERRGRGAGRRHDGFTC